MPLQNRVDPFGEIHAVAARGLFTGNRGVIHDPDTKTLLKRRWTTKAWLICECEFRGRKREVMGRNALSGNAGWTELFFLDEVTALAAGHRPCFYCRRERATEFSDCFAAGNGLVRPKVFDIDARLHGERLASGGKALRLSGEDLGILPDGAMVADGGTAYAVRHGRASRWTFDGYAQAVALDALGAPRLLTPPATVAALRQGYRPAWSDPAARR
ncbi:hypothetical protein RB623_14140 [Mesorhizobium sp. LHD-90]|uniref:hypothetical protein n=1 Tax=Mesorhizobium sp. LHD-90 TaxID=3071414 RepID=UPI0027E1BC43|nr:hypothetical protein [Mesorhizobium sp. LHD-90]MDQ6435193.1 hypothetical protein [Mesorhizobium sp. LHD-90]